MSVRIGEVKPGIESTKAAVHVHASRGGIELHSDPRVTLDPVEARNFAALLVRASDEVERMRATSERHNAPVAIKTPSHMDFAPLCRCGHGLVFHAKHRQAEEAHVFNQNLRGLYGDARAAFIRERDQASPLHGPCCVGTPELCDCTAFAHHETGADALHSFIRVWEREELPR